MATSARSMEDLTAPQGALESEATAKKALRPTGAVKYGFLALSVILFLKTSMVHEVIWSRLGVNSNLISVALVVCALTAIVSGRWVFSLRDRAGRLWFLFGIWSIFSGALGFWPGGSIPQLFFTYLPTNYLVCLLAIAFTTDLRSSRRAMLAMAWGGSSLILISKVMPASDGGRLALDIAGGSVSNPVDLSIHLLFSAGYMAYAAAQSKSWLVRIGLIAGIMLAAQLSLQTGSRTATVGVAAAAISILLWRTTPSRFFTTAAVAAVVVAVAFGTLSGDLVSRLTSFDTNTETEAGSSAETRLELAKRGMEYAFQHPLFGIGFGMFTDFDSGEAIAEGRRGTWKNAHNSFVAVASETGLVGFFFFAAPLFIVLRGLARLEKTASKSPQTQGIATMARYQLLIIFVHCVVACFANFQYMFYLPIMIGLGSATINAAQRELPQGKTAMSLAKTSSVGNQSVPAYAGSGAALRSGAPGVGA